MTQTFFTRSLIPVALPSRLGTKGWTAPSAMTFAEWQQIGSFLGRAERSIYWLIGDWWSAGERWNRQRVRLVRDDPAWRGPSYRLCQDCAWVAGTYNPSRRRENLTFQHHREVAALHEQEADHLLDRAEAEGLSTRQLRVMARRVRARITSSDQASAVRDLRMLEASGQRFATIYADPPWRYHNETLELATANHYSTMTVEELCQLPVRNLAARDAYLHLWVTSAFLVGAPERIFAAWDFRYSGSSFVLVKRKLGLGNYWRIGHEVLLTAIRGNPPRFRDHGLRSWLEVERTGRSFKPEAVRSLIEQASPGPYLELFGRRQVAGWTVWGDEVPCDT